MRQYQTAALRVAFGVTQQRELAEDVVADAFLIVYERFEQYDEGRPFRPWFYRIVINLALRAIRIASRNVQEQISDQLDLRQGPEELLLLGELREMLRAAMHMLPPSQRTVLVLRYYLHMDEREMATVLGRPIGTIKWRLHAARKRLREALGSGPDVLVPELR